MAVEQSVQRALDTGALMWLLGNVYLAAQIVVLPGSLVYLYRRAPAVYRRLRDTVLATWLIAVPIYAAFPVAPPRLAESGMSDVVSSQAAVELTGRSTLFYNELAAVPSLHCGFAVAIAIALDDLPVADGVGALGGGAAEAAFEGAADAGRAVLAGAHWRSPV